LDFVNKEADEEDGVDLTDPVDTIKSFRNQAQSNDRVEKSSKKSGVDCRNQHPGEGRVNQRDDDGERRCRVDEEWEEDNEQLFEGVASQSLDETDEVQVLRWPF
jgi:hypothetical protein